MFLSNDRTEYDMTSDEELLSEYDSEMEVFLRNGLKFSEGKSNLNKMVQRNSVSSRYGAPPIPTPTAFAHFSPETREMITQALAKYYTNKEEFNKVYDLSDEEIAQIDRLGKLIEGDA